MHEAVSTLGSGPETRLFNPRLDLSAGGRSDSWEPALRVEAELVSGASLTCAFIALSISDADLVLFPEAFD